MKTSQKVYVGLSGGVDSSVSAFLLKRAGYQVTGVFIKVWYPDFIECNWRDEMRDAMRICAKLDIPFKICDLEKEYKKHVVDYLIGEYESGRTPNPDVMCNKYIKFDGFLNFALNEGADFVATGHYAQNIFDGQSFHLKKSADQSKDQTYFLWTLTQEKLAKILFPIGHLKKPEVRKIAQKNGLFTATKKDSQGLCFLGHVDIEMFLANFLQTRPGDVLNLEGKVIGRHHGALFYTIGQRHGFNIFENSVAKEKYYVIDKNIEKNILTVSNQEQKKEQLEARYLLKEVNMINRWPAKIKVGYRYHGRLLEAELEEKAGQFYLNFGNLDEKIAAGQSAAAYLDDECLGGGIIC